MLFGHAVAPGRQALQRCGAAVGAGKVAALRFKHDLPNYGVFDEKRVFAAGPAPGPVVLKGVRLGVMVCEDMWSLDASEMLAGERRRAPHRHQRLALRGDEARAAPRSRARARKGERAAAALCQSGRRPGRAGLRRRVLRARGRWRSARPGAGMAAGADADALERARAAAGRSKRACSPSAATGCPRSIRRWCLASAIMCARTDFPAWCWASRAASIPRSRRRWRSMRSAPIASIA